LDQTTEADHLDQTTESIWIGAMEDGAMDDHDDHDE